MAQLIISPTANHDLLDIWDYIADDSPVNADRFLEHLINSAQNLLGWGETGISRPELGEGLRSLPVGRYVLYYRIQGQDIELVRVLHSARDTRLIF